MSSSGHDVRGSLELLADAERPGGWLLTIDRVRQSYVDLEDPGYLDFEYVQVLADVLGALPDGPLAVTHVGGGGCTLARWISTVRPGSPQIVLEPDAELIELVRSRLPLPRGHRIRIRAEDGRTGTAALKDGSADVLVLDAFHGGRVPAELTSAEYFADVARVLRPGGVLLANIADGPPLSFTGRLFAAIRTALPSAVLIADGSVLKARRFGNVVLAASRAPLPLEAIRRSSARAPFPRSVRTSLGSPARPFTDADSARSPQPPDELWRISPIEDYTV